MAERIAWGRRRYARLWRRWATRVLVASMAISLLLHLFELYVIVRGRQLAREQIVALASQLDSAAGSTLELPINIQQPLPVRASVPIAQQITVPIDTSIPISTTITIPLNTPLGTYNVPVPLDMDVPIRTSVPVAINETVAISTTIDLDLRVPLRIAIAETSLAGTLAELQSRLLALAEQL